MRVVKVVHAASTAELQATREQLVVQGYDVEAFISRNRAAILKRAAGAPPEDRTPSAAPPDPLPGKPAWNARRLASRGRSVAEAVIMAYPNRLQQLIRDTAYLLWDDIRQQQPELDLISIDSARRLYPRTEGLSVGTYTLHPRDPGQLARLEHFHRSLAMQKDDELVVLLGKMGARTVTIVDTDFEQKAGSADVVLEALAGDVSIKSAIGDTVSKSKQIQVVFKGDVVDIRPDLLHTSIWFADDSRLKSIFESRCFSANPMQEYTYRSSYTHTFDFDFKLAARYLAVQEDLQAEYESLSQTERYFHVEFAR